MRKLQVSIRLTKKQERVLKHCFRGVSTKFEYVTNFLRDSSLTHRILAELEFMALVKRTVYMSGVVDYSLTRYGQEILEVLK